jgi:hypothetical protein
MKKPETMLPSLAGNASFQPSCGAAQFDSDADCYDNGRSRHDSGVVRQDSSESEASCSVIVLLLSSLLHNNSVYVKEQSFLESDYFCSSFYFLKLQN